MTISSESLFVQLTTLLGDWTARADYTVEREADAVVIANRGGEIRIYVRHSGDGFVVSGAERSDDEVIEMIAADLNDVLRYLTVHLGWDIRTALRLRLSDVVLPAKSSGLAANAKLERVPSSDADGIALVTVVIGGTLRASFPDRREPADAVRFSHYCDQPLDLIRQSFLDPSGAPLFAG